MQPRKLFKALAFFFGLLFLVIAVGGDVPSALAQGPSRAPAACPTPIKKNWLIKGNCGTTAGTHFLGTTDNQSLVVKTNNIERLRVDTTGNVGIGTASPGSNLTVAGVIQSTTGGFKFPDGSTQTTASKSAAAAWLLGGNSGTNPASNFLGTKDNQPLLILTNNAERIRVLANGSVGIGTGSPWAKLQVATANETNINSIFSWDSRYFVVGGAGNSGGIGMSYDQTNNVGNIIALSPSVAWRNLVLQGGGGNVGIGTSSPAAKLVVQGADSGFATPAFQVTNSRGDVGLEVNDDSTLSVNGSANFQAQVGINTTSHRLLTVRGYGSSFEPAIDVQNGSGQDVAQLTDSGMLWVTGRNGSSTNHACYVTNYLGDCSSAAEYVPTIDGGSGFPQTADLVSIAPTVTNPYGDPHGPFTVQKSGAPCDTTLFGFIVNPDSGADGKKLNDHYLPLAIYGYFPANVTLENGAIHRGDPLTSSSKPGFAMKATGACKIIGYALQNATAEGKIQVFAHLGDNAASSVAALGTQVQTLTQENHTLEQELRTVEARLAAIEQALPSTQATTKQLTLSGAP